MEIKVGIKTAGPPILDYHDNYVDLKNMLIGDGFHWQKTIPVILPGKVVFYKSQEVTNQSLTSDHVSLINILPLETYLECVVGSEMNPEAPLEFLKAHAVISRSWALGKILETHPQGNDGFINTDECLIGWEDTASHSGFHVCSDDHCQRYQGIQEISGISLKAIKDTAGEILKDSFDKIVDARFSKCCGGKTEVFGTCWQSREMPCIESFDDPWCNLSSLTPNNRRILLSSILKDYDQNTQGYGYRWETEITKAEIGENLKNKFNRSVGEIKKLYALHRGLSGRIDLLRIEGTAGFLDIGKELWIRRVLAPSHLYSSSFEIEDTGSSIKLIGRGWGHGAGLCQIGAANMASQGASYEEILSFYYPGSIIKKLANEA